MKRQTLLTLLTVTCLLVAIFSVDLRAADSQAKPKAKVAAKQKAKKKAKAKRRRPNPAFAKIKDNPKLPRVLLLGDSISIGYTVPVRKELSGTANLHRPQANCGPTSKGLEAIDQWLGESRWDVIHFNWGLHDLKYIKDKHQVPLEQYEQNLRKLVARLQKTEAKLIWCSTTPVAPGTKGPLRKDEDVVAYNKVALKIMQENNIQVDDLYAFALPQLKKIQRPVNVHFSPEGSAALAEAVAKSIQKALAQ